jgi:hypothetical protein
MATTYTATRAASTFPAYQPVGSGSKNTAWGTIELTVNPAPADVFQMCKLPKGAVIIGGRVKGDKLDSTGAGSACMTVNIGVNKALTTPDGTTVTAASTSNALGAAWAFGSDFSAVLGYKPESGRNLPLGGLLLSHGPLTTTEECLGTVTIITSAGGLTTGTLTMEVDYLVP